MCMAASIRIDLYRIDVPCIGPSELWMSSYNEFVFAADGRSGLLLCTWQACSR